MQKKILLLLFKKEKKINKNENYLLFINKRKTCINLNNCMDGLKWIIYPLATHRETTR